MEHDTTGTQPEAAFGTIQPGDLVAATHITTAYGWVYDIIGGTARIQWTTPNVPGAVEGLHGHPVAGLTLVRRFAAYLCVRFTGTDTDAPYAFVQATDYLAVAMDAERTYRTAERYEITASRFGHAHDTDTTGDSHGVQAESAGTEDVPERAEGVPHPA